MALKRGRHNKGQHKPDSTPQKRVKTQGTHENVQRRSTRIAQAAAAAHQAANQVFGTTELLEQILLNVGTVEDLVRMRRVCHKWQDVIQDTPSLMRIMFLSPQEPDHEWHVFLKDDYTVFRLDKVRKGRWGKDTGILKPARINPLLFYQLNKYAEAPAWWTDSGNHMTSEELHLREGASLQGTKIRVSSQLLNMFATQPPVYKMTFRTGSKSAREIHNSRGFKVIDVIRVAQGLEGGWAGRVVVGNVLFREEDVDVMYTEYYLDRFYPWNR